MTNGTGGRTGKLSFEDARTLERLLATQAVNSPVGVARYFDQLVRGARLTQAFQFDLIGTFTGNAPYDARRLIDWAQAKGTNPHPEERSWTTLGTLLRTLLEAGTLGLEDVATVSGLIELRGLYRDAAARARFCATYGIPDRPPAASAGAIGPDIDWQGPTDRVELQGFFGPTPTDFTLAFLQGAVRRARSVCKISFPVQGRTGTGVLVAPDLVLTNHHVVFGEEGDEQAIEALGRECVVAFEGLGGTGGDATASGSLDQQSRAIVARDRALDFALLRLSAALASAPGLEPAPLADKRPLEKDGLNLLHHPAGAAMRVSTTDAGVTRVLDGPGYLQYVTRSAPGSSGAPCFDDDWQVIALHHAERMKPFGSVGEGILMDRIRTEIRNHLE
jgi:S1-C subfamily serine protease